MRKLLAILGLLPLTAIGAIDYSFTIDTSHLFQPHVTADGQGNLIVTGFVRECLMPAVHALSTCGPMWVAKLEATGQNLLFATYIGDAGMVGANYTLFESGVATDGEGNIVVAAGITKGFMPVVNPLQATVLGPTNLYLLKLAADGSRLIYATYLGGSGYDSPLSLAVDDAGAAYVLATTTSPDFPITPQAVNTGLAGRSIVVKLTPDGRALVYSAGFPWVFSQRPLQLDASGAAWIVVSDSVLELSPDGSHLDRTPLPPWAMSASPWVSPTPGGGLWISGSVTNGELPVTPNALQPFSGLPPYLRIANGAAQPAVTHIPAHEIRHFAVDRAEPTRIYAATDGGLFRSVDNGQTWDQLFAAPSQSILVDPFDSGVLYLGCSPGLGVSAFYRSTDRGQTWSAPAGAPFGAYAVTSLAADPNVQGLLYGTGSGAYRSEDGGLHWTPVNLPSNGIGGGTPTSTYFTTPLLVQTDPTRPRRVYMLAIDHCIGFCPVLPVFLQSNDAGLTVGKAPLGYNSSGSGLAVDPSNGNAWAVVNGSITIFPGSGDGNVPIVAIANAVAVAFDPASPGTVYVSTSDGTILQSADDGATFAPLLQLNAQAAQIAVSAGGVVNASQPAFATDAFAFAYDSTGTLTYGTYLGGGATTTNASAVNSAGHLFLAGRTGPGLPVLNASQAQIAGATDGFLAEFDEAGTLLSSTYLGGSGDDQVDSIVPQGDGSAIVFGTTASTGFPATQVSPLGSGGLFVARLRSDSHGPAARLSRLRGLPHSVTAGSGLF